MKMSTFCLFVWFFFTFFNLEEALFMLPHYQPFVRGWKRFRTPENGSVFLDT